VFSDTVAAAVIARTEEQAHPLQKP